MRANELTLEELNEAGKPSVYNDPMQDPYWLKGAWADIEVNMPSARARVKLLERIARIESGLKQAKADGQDELVSFWLPHLQQLKRLEIALESLKDLDLSRPWEVE